MEISGDEVVFLPRHGRGHRYLPSEVPSRANIWALRSMGVEQILALSAVGSLSENVESPYFVRLVIIRAHDGTGCPAFEVRGEVCMRILQRYSHHR